MANVLREGKNALETLDVEKIVSCYGEGFLLEDAAADQSISERDSLTEYYRRLFAMPGVKFTDIVVYDGGEWAALEWTWHGLRSGTTSKFRVRGASIIELEAGKIKRETLYYDPRPTSG